MAIERRLTEIAGPVGGRLHTARSRNDQVATDLALYTRERPRRPRSSARRADGGAARARRGAPRLADARLHAPAARAAGVPRPPPAGLLLDVRARPRALRLRRARSAAGCRSAPGALAGVNFDTDRGQRRRASSASRASRRTRSTPSPTATSRSTTSRAAATCATHLSRLGAELVLWSSSEFGFCELPDSWSSSSSIMPQKKNPDAAELLRAKAPRVVAHLAALHGVMHAPAADLQQGPAGGQGAPVRRRPTRSSCASRRRAGCSTGARFDRERDERGGRRRADRRDRRRRPAGEARHALPRGARDRRGARARRARGRQAALAS